MSKSKFIVSVSDKINGKYVDRDLRPLNAYSVRLRK